MKSKKRKKNTRYRGSHTAQNGAKKKGRGKGHRGGVGKAGSGKRADQKKSKYALGPGKSYFGKRKTLRKPMKEKLKSINLRTIAQNFSDKKEVTLKGYKVLSVGEPVSNMKITASAASKVAIDKVKKAGGDIILA